VDSGPGLGGVGRGAGEGAGWAELICAWGAWAEGPVTAVRVGTRSTRSGG